MAAPTAITDPGQIWDKTGLALRVSQIQNASGTVLLGAQAATVAALTDSSGYDGTHNDTIAAMAAITTLTDSTGLSGTHDDTLAATTVPAALTENSGAIGGSSDGDLPALVDPSGDAGASVIAGIRENATKINAIITLLGVMTQNESDTAQKVIELVAREIVIAQNISDLTQKVNELRSAMIDAGVLASA